MAYDPGDKVKLRSGRTEHMPYYGMVATIKSGAYTFTGWEYYLEVDEDGAVFFCVPESCLEFYLAAVPPKCTCDLVRGGCTCAVGMAELAAEREKLREPAS